MGLKVASFFSGVGGFEMGLQRVFPDMEVVFASEIDKHARKSYQAIHGHLPSGDITKIHERDIPEHDLIVGGFPCQSFSIAGHRKGFADTRGTLFFEIARVAAYHKPKVLLLENVKGLVNHDKGETLLTILKTLNEIGYVVDFEVLNSKYFDLPQNRERVFIVAIREDLQEEENWEIKNKLVVGKAKQNYQEQLQTFNFDFPKQENITVKLKDILEDNPDPRLFVDTSFIEWKEPKERDIKIQGKFENSKFNSYKEVYSPEGDTPSARAQGDILKVATDTSIKYETVARVYGTEGIAPCLNKEGSVKTIALKIKEGTKKGYAEAEPGDSVSIGFPNSKNRRGRVGKEIANTILAGAVEQTVVTDDFLVRKLSSLEYWRLQGFSDEDYYKAKTAGVSNSQLYKQAGNAVSKNVIEAIGRKLSDLI